MRSTGLRIAFVVVIVLFAFGNVRSALAGGQSTVVGTKWSTIDSDGDSYTYWFKANGVLEYNSPHGHAGWDGSYWHQEGNQISWVINHYSRYSATMTSSGMVGSATNPAGHRWTFTLHQETTAPSPVSDSTWNGVDSDGARWTVVLHQNGTLTYSGASSGTGHWALNDNGYTVTLEINNYSRWTSTIDGNTMFGNGDNISGQQWTFTATRSTQPGNP